MDGSRITYPESNAYSRFCDLYREWTQRRNIVMRQQHVAGEKLWVDYAGDTVPIHDSGSGEVRQASIFVAVLGVSSCAYAEATWSQELNNWIGSHVRTFEYLGGLPAIVIPDNLKSGVTRANRYEPDVNPTFQEIAEHYDVAVIPARPYRARDKAKVESGVLLVERWILAALRKHKFFHLSSLNQAIAELLHRLRYSGLRIRDVVTLKIDESLVTSCFFILGRQGRLYGVRFPHLSWRLLIRFLRKAITFFGLAIQNRRAQSGIGSGHLDDSLFWPEYQRAMLTGSAIPLLSNCYKLVERVAVMLGHRSVKVTEKYYSAWNLRRQEQLEADVRRTWNETPTGHEGYAAGTREKTGYIN